MFTEDKIPQQIFTVSEITSYIRFIFENNTDLQDIWIQGEISNVSYPNSGHIYLTLKDQEASLRCVIWKWQVPQLQFLPRDGMKMEAHGKFSIYEKGGSYQFYIDAVRKAGEGELFQEFLRLKQKLTEEGIFDEENKIPVPQFPNLIGIVTSETAAALQDILNTLRARYPLAKVVLSPTQVQGEKAPPLIIDALQRLQKLDVTPDVILIARGGGSIEDLWAFNDEFVARAVADCEIPIISGVGHETDFTLTDFAADVRAPTPTGAAVLAVPDWQELTQQLKILQSELINTIDFAFSENKNELKDLDYQIFKKSPENKLQQNILLLDDLNSRLFLNTQFVMNRIKGFFNEEKSKMLAYNPDSVLSRGYSILYDKNSKVINSIERTKVDEQIGIRLQDGDIKARIEQINNKSESNGKE